MLARFCWQLTWLIRTDYTRRTGHAKLKGLKVLSPSRKQKAAHEEAFYSLVWFQLLCISLLRGSKPSSLASVVFYMGINQVDVLFSMSIVFSENNSRAREWYWARQKLLQVLTFPGHSLPSKFLVTRPKIPKVTSSCCGSIPKNTQETFQNIFFCFPWEFLSPRIIKWIPCTSFLDLSLPLWPPQPISLVSCRTPDSRSTVLFRASNRTVISHSLQESPAWTSGQRVCFTACKYPLAHSPCESHYRSARTSHSLLAATQVLLESYLL